MIGMMTPAGVAGGRTRRRRRFGKDTYASTAFVRLDRHDTPYDPTAAPVDHFTFCLTHASLISNALKSCRCHPKPRRITDQSLDVR